jgi:hypothetical protein
MPSQKKTRLQKERDCEKEQRCRIRVKDSIPKLKAGSSIETPKLLPRKHHSFMLNSSHGKEKKL